MRLKNWEVYRQIPQSWGGWQSPGPHPYWWCYTFRRAQKMADTRNAELRRDRSDEEFAVFKVRRRP